MGDDSLNGISMDLTENHAITPLRERQFHDNPRETKRLQGAQRDPQSKSSTSSILGPLPKEEVTPPHIHTHRNTPNLYKTLFLFYSFF